MSYEPTNWKSGDTVTSAKLNKMEQGIANAGGGGGALVVHDVDGTTLDKTWQEIHDAAPLVWKQNDQGFYDSLAMVSSYEGQFFVIFSDNKETVYMSNSADGYPELPK